MGVHDGREIDLGLNINLTHSLPDNQKLKMKAKPKKTWNIYEL